MSLIRRAKTNPHAFTKLYQLHVQGIYRYFASRLHEKSSAEDLTSYVWETVLKNIQHLNSDKEIVFKAWLFTIARNALNKHFLEKQKNTLELKEAHSEIKTQDPQPNEEAQKKEDLKQIQKLLSALPNEQRESITLRYFSDLRNKEIAKILCVSEKTVASNISRGLQTLKEIWKKLQ